jgi:hypothetical protein
VAESAGGLSFPLLTTPLHLRAAELSAVFATYPNPFNAGQGTARIVYYLKSPGNVRLQIRSLGGDLIKTIVDADTPVGLQETAWDGRNEQGRQVLSGVYLGCIEIRYTDGTRDRLVRKLALVR